MKCNRFFIFCLASIVLLPGCEKYYLSVKREVIDRNSLASTFVGSPDPRQSNPPKGQALIMQWRLPREALDEPLVLTLKILYRNYSEETISYPVERRRGVITYSLLGEDYISKEGFLTYKAEIIAADGKVVQEWKQLLWTNLVTIEEPDAELD